MLLLCTRELFIKFRVTWPICPPLPILLGLNDQTKEDHVCVGAGAAAAGQRGGPPGRLQELSQVHKQSTAMVSVYDGLLEIHT